MSPIIPPIIPNHSNHSNHCFVGVPNHLANHLVKGAPYLLGYTVQDQKLVILALLHSKQQWPGSLD